MQCRQAVARTLRLLTAMKANPKAGWSPENVRTLACACNLRLRQWGTSHAVLKNALDQHLTVPMHKAIKPGCIRRLVRLIEAAQ